MLNEVGYRNLNGLDVLLPNVRHFSQKAKNGFSFIKANHGFWDLFSNDPFWKEKYQQIFDIDLINEVKEIILNISKFNIDLAVSPIGTPRQMFSVESNLSVLIKKCLPNNYVPYYAVCWKIYALSGQFNYFFESIVNKKIVIVGLEHLREVKQSFSKNNIENFVIDFTSSKPKNRNRILENLKNKIHPDTVFLFQAGDIFSTWLIHKLSFISCEGCSFIDVGRSIDYYCPNKFLNDIDTKLYPLELNNFYNQPWLIK